jgi:ribonuclease BN (tRNA processing enzyme)
MADRLVLLGTGTCQLQEHRAASSVLIELAGLRLVFDFGRGVATRLAALGLRQDDVAHVALSHFHVDHVSDLVPYLHAGSWSLIDPRTRDLHLWGPPGLQALMSGLFELFEGVRRDGGFGVEVHEVAGDSMTIEGREFRFVDLPPAGNRGLKFACGETTCALTGDSHFHEQEVEFLTGVDVAVIDAGHLGDDDIVELASRSGARTVVCSHLYRELDGEVLAMRASDRGFGGEIIVGDDLMVFDLSRGIAGLGTRRRA